MDLLADLRPAWQTITRYESTPRTSIDQENFPLPLDAAHLHERSDSGNYTYPRHHLDSHNWSFGKPIGRSTSVLTKDPSKKRKLWITMFVLPGIIGASPVYNLTYLIITMGSASNHDVTSVLILSIFFVLLSTLALLSGIYYMRESFRNRPTETLMQSICGQIYMAIVAFYTFVNFSRIVANAVKADILGTIITFTLFLVCLFALLSFLLPNYNIKLSFSKFFLRKKTATQKYKRFTP